MSINNGYLVVMEIYSHTNIDESFYSKRVARKRVLPPMHSVYSSRTLLQAFRSNCCIRKFLKLFRISIVSIKKKNTKGRIKLKRGKKKLEKQDEGGKEAHY